MSTPKSPLRRWLDAQPRGAASALARTLGVSRQRLYHFAEDLRYMPRKTAEVCARITGLSLPDLPWTEKNLPSRARIRRGRAG